MTPEHMAAWSRFAASSVHHNMACGNGQGATMDSATMANWCAAYADLMLAEMMKREHKQEIIPICCYVGCGARATKSLFDPGHPDPYNGTHSCDAHLADLQAIGDMVEDISPKAARP